MGAGSPVVASRTPARQSAFGTVTTASGNCIEPFSSWATGSHFLSRADKDRISSVSLYTGVPGPVEGLETKCQPLARTNGSGELVPAASLQSQTEGTSAWTVWADTSVVRLVRLTPVSSKRE